MIRIASLALVALISSGVQAQQEAPDQLAALFSEFFEENLTLNPLQATFIGDNRYNDRLPNVLGEAYIERSKAFDRKWRERILAVSRDELSGQDRLSYDIFLYDRDQALAGYEFPGQWVPLNQFFSFANFAAQLGSGRSAQPFQTVVDYENWLERSADLVVIFDQSIANMRVGMKNGVVQPRPIMEKVLPQLAAHVVDDVDESIFMMPVQNFPESIDDDAQARLAAAYRDHVANELVPAYRRLHDFVRDEYLPATRDSVGWSALPDGKRWYEYQISTFTTTLLDADDIHAFGLEEVARIRSEMEQVMVDVGFEGTLAEFFAYVQEEDQFYYDDAEALLQGYRDLQTKVNALLPTLFNVMPKADYEVRAVEAFRAASAAGASYQAPSPDGSRPGVFYVNTHNLRSQPKYGMETLSIHEASPGHHFQIALQQEVESLPAFRRFGGYSAYSEGWALYAESLGREMGMFTDPYQYYGRLSDEMLRAMRLVVDTGLHAKGWSRQQAIDYMRDNSSMAPSDIVAEVERYIAIPGQALGYKIGERVIRNLREQAAEALGEKFDVREFHTQILIDGAMPLDVLKRKIADWIDAQQAGQA